MNPTYKSSSASSKSPIELASGFLPRRYSMPASDPSSRRHRIASSTQVQDILPASESYLRPRVKSAENCCNDDITQISKEVFHQDQTKESEKLKSTQDSKKSAQAKRREARKSLSKIWGFSFEKMNHGTGNRGSASIPPQNDRGHSSTQKLSKKYWLEKIDKTHRYGKILNIHRKVWAKSETNQPFFTWLEERLDSKKNDKIKLETEDKELNLYKEIYGKIWNKMNESTVIPFTWEEGFAKWKVKIDNISQVKYCNKDERKAYLVKVDKGKLYYSNNNQPVHNGSFSLIFVWGSDENLYVGPYKRGEFHHSSFLKGKPIKAAGELYCRDGKLEIIQDMCGHYFDKHPLKHHEQILNFLNFLKNKEVKLGDIALGFNSHPESEYRFTTWEADDYIDFFSGNFDFEYLGRVNEEQATDYLKNNSHTNAVIRDLKKNEKNREGNIVPSKYIYQFLWKKDGKIHDKYIITMSTRGHRQKKIAPS